jgi:hypothetical protein
MSQTQAFFTTQRSTLIAVAISTFMLPLDFTVVSVALHDIEIEFAASFTDLQWVVNSSTSSLLDRILIWNQLVCLVTCQLYT